MGYLKSIIETDLRLIYPDKWSIFLMEFTERSFKINYNGSEIFHHISETPMIFYWFCVSPNDNTGKSWIVWSANCEPPEIDGPPRDGGWSNWSPWQCSVSCGGGEGFRTRTCSNPRPNIYGKLCEGSTIVHGYCNEFECGDIGPDTTDQVRNHLRKHNYTFLVDEGEKLTLINNQDIIIRLKKEAPKLKYEWSLNGMSLGSNSSQNFTIENAKPTDNGVYICTAHRINKKRFIIAVYSVGVLPKRYTVVTRVGRELTLLSNAAVLGYVYRDLSQKWTLNDTVVVDHGITTLIAVTTEHIPSLNFSHNGIWKCVIEQTDLKLSWVTNLVTVRVKKKANLLTHLMEDAFTKHIFGKLKNEMQVVFVLIGIAVGVFLIVFLITFAYLKWGRMPDKKNKHRKRKYKNAKYSPLQQK